MVLRGTNDPLALSYVELFAADLIKSMDFVRKNEIKELFKSTEILQLYRGTILGEKEIRCLQENCFIVLGGFLSTSIS